MAYLDITLETDKWYISEGFMSMPAPATPEEAELMIRHNQSPGSMVLGGPFATKEKAESYLNQYSGYKSPYVWHCMLGTATRNDR